MQAEIAVAARKFISGLNLGYEIAYDNSKFDPPAGKIYIAIHVMPSVDQAVDLARKSRIYISMVQVDIVAPINSGETEAKRLADKVAKLFEDGKIIPLSTVTPVLNAFVSEQGEVFPALTGDTAFKIPVRAYIRLNYSGA